MYTGTSGVSRFGPETPGNTGATCETRTRDPIITNKGYPRQTALFSPNCVPISPRYADLNGVAVHFQVHMYIGPKADCSPLPALTTNAKEARYG